MKNISIWNDIKLDFKGSKLNSNKLVDVAIIGGGITGISTAFHLCNSGLDVCLVEKNKICSGVTSRTTGKLTYLQDNMYSKINRYHSLDKAKLYLQSQIDAMNMVKDIIKNNNIDCDLERVRSYIFSDDKKVDDEVKLFRKMGISLLHSKKLPDGRVTNAYYINDSYVFHPLKYLNKLANIVSNNGIDIYENTNVVSIDKDESGLFSLMTEKYKISARKVVIAVHYPYFILPFLMPFKSYLEKSYIGAWKVNKNYKYSAISVSKPIQSIRFQKDKTSGNIYQIYLSNVHNYCVKNNEVENFYQIRDNGDDKVDYLWSNKDIITNDYLPYIGILNDSNMFIGTGYNTWGMTNGSLAGKIISDLILDGKSKYSELFKPNRGINLGSIKNFPIILWSSAYSFLKNKISKQKSWYSDRVKFEKRNGKNVAIYIDDGNIEHVVYNLCPHLKCSLIFNEIEKTWDCPCHGSRFNIDGDVIEGPSNYSIRFKK